MTDSWYNDWGKDDGNVSGNLNRLLFMRMFSQLSVTFTSGRCDGVWLGGCLSVTLIEFYIDMKFYLLHVSFNVLNIKSDNLKLGNEECFVYCFVGKNNLDKNLFGED